MLTFIELPNQELSGAKFELQGQMVGVCSFYKRGGQPNRELPNQELSLLYGRPTLNYERQLSLYFPHMLRVNLTRDLAHMQLSDLQGEIRPICRTSDLQGERILIRRT